MGAIVVVLLGVPAILAATGGMVVLTAVQAGYVIMRLWAWFAVPLGAPPIGLWHAVGIDLLVTYVAMYVGDHKKDEREVDWKTFMMSLFVRPWLFLLLGYLAHRWM